MHLAVCGITGNTLLRLKLGNALLRLRQAGSPRFRLYDALFSLSIDSFPLAYCVSQLLSHAIHLCPRAVTFVSTTGREL